eukprot:CAMPEP_0171736526 /NCGR_PEP_ID=MMETSP0991-20121206/32311_1 /TAXON_ID=483369 /ORGANISM="non described non described, Strain CCMP2098" /LENGTH=330 /DNA_ID=CAMNT_0012333211 /DNA_START=17 /DNA_END=1009 /DNA_ORIENTATION=+
MRIQIFVNCALLLAGVSRAKNPTVKRPLLTRQQKIEHALTRANHEQETEDYNSFQRCEGSLHRRVICLPLTEHFDPPPGQQGHGKLQVSDRVSIPKELMTGVFKRCPVPPWQFEIRKIPQAAGKDDDNDEEEEEEEEDASLESALAAVAAAADAAEVGGTAAEAGGGASKGKEGGHSDPAAAAAASRQLEHLYCHVLDWQAPRNYVFVPRWMMTALKLKPREVIELTWCRLREGKQVTLKPHTKDFVNWANPQAVMESELKYYSSLTLGSTIVIDYKGAKHALEVVRVVDGEEQLDGANIQDVNVAVDFEGVGPQIAKNKAKRATAGRGV